jgi:CRISPR-associated protein Csx17
LCALGEAERHLITAERWRSENRLVPLGGLSPAWINSANDGSVEFELALSISGIHDAGFKVDPLRANLEPVSVGRRQNGGVYINWAEKDRKVVWNSTNLSTNLAAVLERRVLDGGRLGCTYLPLAFRYGAPLESIAAWLARSVDQTKIARLLWGLVLIDHDNTPLQFNRAQYTFPLPRAYALLKLLFLPKPLVIEHGTSDKETIRFTRMDESGLRILPEPRLLALLKAGQVDAACEIAIRRLRASGLAPMPVKWTDLGILNGIDLAAALLIPIPERSIRELVNLVARTDATV